MFAKPVGNIWQWSALCVLVRDSVERSPPQGTLDMQPLDGVAKRVAVRRGPHPPRHPPRLHRAKPLQPLQQGVPARVAMETLGFADSLTSGTYSHVAPELTRDAADRMGEARWG